jgi:hypothetical protein
VQKLVIVINGAESGDVLERWVFNVETDKDSLGEGWVILILCVIFVDSCPSPEMRQHPKSNRKRRL